MLRNLNLKFCREQNNKNDLLHLIVIPQLSDGWEHNYSTKTSQVGLANEQYMFSLKSMLWANVVRCLIIVTKVLAPFFDKMFLFKLLIFDSILQFQFYC